MWIMRQTRRLEMALPEDFNFIGRLVLKCVARMCLPFLSLVIMIFKGESELIFSELHSSLCFHPTSLHTVTF